ncbi:MAG: RidA family protein [Elusimicrobia bacterium]|nr:RidA family protein [Elusimicrobiota bacterium]
MNKAVATEQAPKAIGPYSQAIESGDWLFVSGQIPLDPDGKPVSGDIAAQTRRCLENLSAILREAGLDLRDVVKTTVYMTDLGQFRAMNEAYSSYFHAPYPARATVGITTLPRDALVEIEAIARRPVAAKQ